jgi:hypothetical protein
MGLNDSPTATAPAKNPFGTSMSSGDRLKDYVGRLILVTPTEFIEDFQTSIGEAEVIIADVVVIDEKDVTKSKELTSTVIFGRALVPYLKRKMEKGEQALGRYVQREPASKGKSGAYAIEAPTNEEIGLGLKYLQSLNPFATEGSDSEG